MRTTPGVCYICGRHGDTALHHILPGALRKTSTMYGLWVFLCPDCHQYAPESVHRCPKTDMALRARCQRVFERLYDHDEWMRIAHKNYL